MSVNGTESGYRYGVLYGTVRQGTTLANRMECDKDTEIDSWCGAYSTNGTEFGTELCCGTECIRLAVRS